jgi:hypothetical protein
MPEYLEKVMESFAFGHQHRGSRDDQLLDTATLAAQLGMDDAAGFILARIDRYGLSSSAYVARLERLRSTIFEQTSDQT